MPTALPAAPGTEAEPNDTTATATPIEAGERIRAPRTVGDVDHYRFTAEAGDRVFAAALTSGSARVVGLAVGAARFRRHDGARVRRRRRLVRRGCRRASPGDDPGGRHVLPGVDGRPGRISSPVRPACSTSSRASRPRRPSRTTPGTRRPLDGRLVSGTRAPGDQDLYAIELGAGDTVFLSLDLDPERDGAASTGGSPSAGRAAPRGRRRRTSDGIPSEAFVSTVTAPAATRVGRRRRRRRQSGTYLLSVTVIPAVERSCRTYAIAPSAGAIADRAATSFPIDVTDAATIDHVALRLDLTHTFMADLDATLEAPAGNRVAVFDDIGATTAGDSAHAMLAMFDDNAGVPPHSTVAEGVGLQPEIGCAAGLVRGPAGGRDVEPHVPRRRGRGRRHARASGPDPLRPARGGADRDRVLRRVRERRGRLHALRHRRRMGARHARDRRRRDRISPG